ncbi:MAG TPA: serine hydrolase domain-containing protein [Lacipirellulaceae bacterium]|nr:serine hydrolase domain-containing protein [Lacipirellulaceae bacterium]
MNRLMCLSSLNLLILGMLVRVPASAADLPTSTPEAEGMSVEKLAKVGEIMNGFVKDKKIAGGIVLIARNGKVVFDETYGLRNLDGKLPVEHDTIFRIYSMSKAITSAAALTLVEEGKLDLDAPVSKYLPEFADTKVFDGDNVRPAKSPITVRDLFRHTSGITYGGFGGSKTDSLIELTNAMDLQSDLSVMSAKLGQIPFEFDPGTKWKYGASIDVLGYIVQKVSGKPLDKFIKERVLDPLEMNDTGFFVPAEKQSRFAANYFSDGKGRLIVRDDPAKSGYLHKPGLFSGGGGMVGTASDYMRLLLMVANGGEWNGKRILSRELAEQMHTNQLPKGVDWIDFGEKRTGVGFGLGFSVTVEPGEKAPHNHKDEFGWGGAASTHYWVSPRDKLAVVTMEQRWPYSPETEEMLKPVIYDAIVK